MAQGLTPSSATMYRPVSYSSLWTVSGFTGTSTLDQWRAVVKANTTTMAAMSRSAPRIERVTQSPTFLFFGDGSIGGRDDGYGAVAAYAAAPAGAMPVRS